MGAATCLAREPEGPRRALPPLSPVAADIAVELDVSSKGDPLDGADEAIAGVDKEGREQESTRYG